MKTKKFILENGDCFGFEVSNSWISRSGVLNTVKKIECVKVTKRPLLFSWFREDIFCEFELNNQKFFVEEPFGDNSMYDIFGETSNSKELEIIHSAFATKKYDTYNMIYWLIFIGLLGLGILNGKS